MKFEIDFNNESDDNTLLLLGGHWVETGATKYPPFEIIKLEIENFEHLEALLDKLETIKGKRYDAVVTFDPPVIFFE